MALKSDPYSTIQPFWHINCPVCGGDDFTELGTGGGVWCDECNTQFSVRGTSGDAGCVVDAKFDDVVNLLKHDGKKYAWRKALDELGGYVKQDWPSGKKPILYAYRIMKEPGMTGTYCTDDRGWILSTNCRVPDSEIPAILKDDKGLLALKYLRGEPMVSWEAAVEWGKQID
jgi:hypothetical protein